MSEPRPLVVIEPSRGWSGSTFRELWRYRELFYFLAWRDVKVRYKQTLLGVAWAVIQPLATMIVFSVLFGRLARIDSGSVPYPIFAFTGLLPWTFFSSAVTSGATSLVGNANLLTKVYFPRVIVPAAAVGAVLVDFAIGLGLLAVLLTYYGIAPAPKALLLPIPILLTFLLALAVATTLAALTVRYRDLRHALPFAMQLWMFATPIIYPPSLLPPRWRALLQLNPLTGIIESFRAILLPGPLSLEPIGQSAAITLALLIGATILFKKVERSLADLI